MPEPGALTDPVVPPPVRRPLWRDRRFLTWWSAQSVSELGDRVSELAVPLVAAVKAARLEMSTARRTV